MPPHTNVVRLRSKDVYKASCAPCATRPLVLAAMTGLEPALLFRDRETTRLFILMAIVISLVLLGRIELPMSDYQSPVIPFNYKRFWHPRRDSNPHCWFRRPEHFRLYYKGIIQIGSDLPLIYAMRSTTGGIESPPLPALYGMLCR